VFVIRAVHVYTATGFNFIHIYLNFATWLWICNSHARISQSKQVLYYSWRHLTWNSMMEWYSLYWTKIKQQVYTFWSLTTHQLV